MLPPLPQETFLHPHQTPHSCCSCLSSLCGGGWQGVRRLAKRAHSARRSERYICCLGWQQRAERGLSVGCLSSMGGRSVRSTAPGEETSLHPCCSPPPEQQICCSGHHWQAGRGLSGIGGRGWNWFGRGCCPIHTPIDMGLLTSLQNCSRQNVL